MENNLVNENMDERPVQEAVQDTEFNPNKEQVQKKLIILGVVAFIIIAGLVTATRKLYTPPIVVEGCNPGDNFSQTTGMPCNGESKETPCLTGELFDKTTGEPCPGV